MPVLIYFSAIVHALAHFGVLNYFILKISWLYITLLGTTPAESLVAVGSVFVGTVNNLSKCNNFYHSSIFSIV